MSTLSIKNLGQIREANLDFGDLTILVGPQATGKSIALQLLKLVTDTGYVQEEMQRYGLDWSGQLAEFLDIYFGEGMRSIYREGATRLEWQGDTVDLKKLVGRRRKNKDESLFFIPAQRVLTLRDGWPRPFTDYTPGDPFAVREFSEKLRVLVEQEFTTASLFPQKKRLKGEFRKLLQDNIFSSFGLRVDKFRSQKRLVLGPTDSADGLPYMVWSAGQREFVPLMLGFYWLMPPTAVPRRGDIRWVVIEELEMGLHPRAISVGLLMVFELVARGYKVCLSTHSSQVLEAIWALDRLRVTKGTANELLGIFGAPTTQPMQRLAEETLKATVKVHYFERESGITRDISSLKTNLDDYGETAWGGLTEFSGRANDAVAYAVANASRRGGRVP